jgi:hypothetical protein
MKMSMSLGLTAGSFAVRVWMSSTTTLPTTLETMYRRRMASQFRPPSRSSEKLRMTNIFYRIEYATALRPTQADEKGEHRPLCHGTVLSVIPSGPGFPTSHNFTAATYANSP